MTASLVRIRLLLIILAVGAVLFGSAWLGRDTVDGSRGSSSAPARDSRVVFADDAGLHAASVRLDGETIQVVRDDRSVLLDGPVYSPSLSPNGELVAYVTPQGKSNDVFVSNLDGTDSRAVTTTSDVDETGPTWSPDGTQLVFERTDSSGKAEIVVHSLATGKENQITANDTVDAGPTWSADGSQIVFFRNLKDQLDLFSYNLGTRETKQLTNTPDVNESSPSFAPDSARIVFMAYSDEAVKEDASPLERIRATRGGNSVRVLSEDGSSTEISPAGEILNPIWVASDTIAFARLDRPGPRVVAISLDRDRETAVLVNIGTSTFDWEVQ